MQHGLKGQNILITGAGSGIGRACAVACAAEGARLALLGRTAAKLEEVLAEIGGAAAGHVFLTADTSRESEMKAALEALPSSFNTLHGVVANAGINGVWAPLDELTAEEWDATLAVNLRGTFLTLKLTLPLLRRRDGGGGSVVVVSSVNGTRMFSNTGATAYACSKAAQVAFVKMTALELAKDRIRVNAVCPGSIESNIDDSTERRHLDDIRLPVDFPRGAVPLTGGPSAPADTVAGVIGFLLGDASRHVSGAVLHVDGAQSLFQG